MIVYGIVLNFDFYFFLIWILDEDFKRKYDVLSMENNI